MTISIYAAVLALFYVALSVKTLLLRRKLKIDIGDGENKFMHRAMRVHANFAEYTPIGLILILLIEISGDHQAMVHFTSMCLLFGRCIHAYGVSKQQENYIFRVAGMALTFTSICSSASFLLRSAIVQA